jgi:adenine/guanine/hypoxanthine permease
MSWFVKRDIDGFFGLAIDNLVQLLLIVQLCSTLCGMSGDNGYFISRHILPGAAVSILVGNVFYSFQARRLMRREGRQDVTALPYGINTPSLLVYVFFVMQPTYQGTLDGLVSHGMARAEAVRLAAQAAWQMGLIACLGSGLIEFAGAFVAGALRRHTPRAALLSTLAGIAIGFIAMTFALRIWARPLVAMLPLAIILITYFARVRFPSGLPGGFLAVLCGTVLAWVLPTGWTMVPVSLDKVAEAWQQRGGKLPIWSFDVLLTAIREQPKQILGFLSVIVPMGLFNVTGSLQNLESAEAAGDRYATMPSLAVNGIGTILAACFGSCFPTTIYIGHPGWKGLGARAGYSILNGVVITVICLTGTVGLLASCVPIEAGIAIVLWIGVVIAAQAFQVTPRKHAPAVAIGLFPAIAAWGATLVWGAFLAAKLVPAPDGAPVMIPVGPATDMQTLITSTAGSQGTNTEIAGFLLHGLNLMERGYIFTCMILAAVAAFLIDRKFTQAAVWSLAGALLAGLGLTHAYQLTGNIVDNYFLFSSPPARGVAFHAWGIAGGYLLFAGVFLAVGYYQTSRGDIGMSDELQDLH